MKRKIYSDKLFISYIQQQQITHLYFGNIPDMNKKYNKWHIA